MCRPVSSWEQPVTNPPEYSGIMTRTIDQPKPGATDTVPAPPCAVYDLDVITTQVQRMRAYLDESIRGSQIFYALKACYLQPVVRHIVALGCGLEVMSPIEHRIAGRVGVTTRDIIWNGPALDEPTLRGAMQRGERINVDSIDLFHVVRRLAAALGAPIEVGLRLNLSGDGKLGITPDLAEPLLRSSQVRVVGFHIHHGARSRGTAHWIGQRRVLLEWLTRWEQQLGIEIRYVDVGGGFQPEHEPAAYLDPIIAAMGGLRSKPKLFVEPGAYFVEEAGIAWARVVAVKRVGKTRWALTDLGAQFLVPLDRSRYEIDQFPAGRGDRRVSIAGPMCFEADVIARDQLLDVTRGDVVRIRRCGAYTASMTSCFGAAPPCIYWRRHGRVVRVERDLDGDELFMNMHGYGQPDS
jgi:diaminopimelate decarboxylase